MIAECHDEEEDQHIFFKIIFKFNFDKMRMIIKIILLFSLLASLIVEGQSGKTYEPVVSLLNGQLRGATNPETGIEHFWGVPYAQPPVNELRWREPQPVKKWNGVLDATRFKARPMQKHNFFDMRFRSDSMSEDCLYLNVWTPDTKVKNKLPVLVYFFGGGFVGGDGSEWRYDGENIAQNGIVVVTVNYRLGIFGFFAHPELTKESPNHASGNYGLLDQSAALRWVQKNIDKFGGDPSRVTIAGESAGSFSVSAQMASPLSKNLIVGAIGESGSILGPTLRYVSLNEAEKNGSKFGDTIGAKTLSQLRSIPAEKLLNIPIADGAGGWPIVVDGYFFPEAPMNIFRAGKQAQVPLLAGWNSTEMPYMVFMQGKMPTPENYKEVVKIRFGKVSDRILNAFPGNTMEEVIESSTNLSSIFFIVYSTWKWAELQRQTSNHPVYQYIFGRPRPLTVNGPPVVDANPLPPALKGAGHSWEIEYALGNLRTNPVYDWTPEDFKVSGTMEEYFTNFIKTGNPNGRNVPLWLPNVSGGNKDLIIDIDVNTKLRNLPNKEQLELIDELISNNEIGNFKLF